MHACAPQLAENSRMGRLRALIDFISRHRTLCVVALLSVFPLVTPYYALATNILLWGLFAVGFNLLFGYTGMLSFGHAAFLGTGAYWCGMMIVHGHWPWYAAIFAAIAGSAGTALLVGYLAIRSRGIYFSMVTLALSQCLYYVYYKADRWTGGENGLRGINIGKINLPGVELDFLNPAMKYYLILAFVAPALWFVSRILSSPFGAVLEAVRENESRAAACGYDVARTKLVAFVLSGAISGLAGALFAIHLSTVSTELLYYIISGQVIMMALLGGMGTFFGPFVGAGVFVLLEDGLSLWTEHWQLYVGTLFVLFVLFFPRGIWGSILHWLQLCFDRK
jgi:branched-chain amino acid transport system permease protein